jgi:predicted GNAT family N-acyltransferase
MEVVELGRLTPEQREELEGDEHDPFDAAGATLSYRSTDHHVALRHHGRLVACTGMLVVDVEVRRERFAVVGFGGVIVNARHRGIGLARKVLQAALAKAETLGPAFAILFCHDDRIGVYLKLGFHEVSSAVRVEQRHGYAVMPEHTMWRALTPGRSWAGGPVRLHGLPF